MKLILQGIFLLLFANTRPLAQVNLQDSAALVDLYNSTGGSSWTSHSNWLASNQSVSEWEGVVVSGNRVISVSLSNNNLVGTLSASIGNLNALTVLDLSGNALTGQIPATINNLTLVESLSLSSNNFTNTIPSLNNLTNLAFCEFYNNNLSGAAPDFSGNLSLFYLDLSFNSLAGSVPELSVSNTPDLFYIDLSENSLNGNIPASVSGLTKLETIKLNKNQITGTIPADLSNLENLSSLALSNNQLTGSIPTTFGSLSNLATLALSFNQLTGGIPTGLATIPGLSDLRLDHNQLSGIIPSGFCTHSFESLYINNNQFTFDGMECLENNSEISSLNYANQKTLTIQNNNFTLSVDAGGTLANNTYTWFKNGDLFTEKIADPTLSATEDGTYRVEVRNSIATQLILLSNPIILSALPLTWLNFTASNCSDIICLQWQTVNEQHTSHFEIERSVDGTSFQQFSKIASKNTAGTNQYSAKDHAAAYGTNYYRIKQVDLDGRYSYSDIISVKAMNTGRLIVRPNPANNFIMISGIDKAERVILCSVSGQIVRQWQQVSANQQLHISDLQKGIYLIKIQHDKGETVQKLIKQ